jgi:acyl-CoA thioester hydrolase
MAEGVAFAVRSMEIAFDGAAHIDDLLTVETGIAAVSGARLTLQQTIRRDAAVLTRALVVVVAIKAGGGPARMPAQIRALAASQRGG